MAATFKVFGNWGTLTCCAISGDVLSYNRDSSDWEKPGDGYDDIARIDLAEWSRAYPGKSIDSMSLDILDVGYWTISHQYEPAAEFHRQMVSAGCGAVTANEALGNLLNR